MSTYPTSCDTFVALPPATRDGCVIFGKNSDRPRGEVQEIVYYPSCDYDLTESPNVACTYISIPQVQYTHAVVLSKPVWMWGAEMGANDCGVCVGNEAVWTRLHDSRLPGESPDTSRLLGMDLVRLALERAASARAACDVIAALLERHGQGGVCGRHAQSAAPLYYHNSFLVADSGGEAWVLETAGRYWVAECVTGRCRNISNCLSIGSGYQRCHARMESEACRRGFWDGQGRLDFAAVFARKPLKESDGSDGSVLEYTAIIDPGASPAAPVGTTAAALGLVRDGNAASLAGAERFLEGRGLLEAACSRDGEFGADSMMQILRHRPSGICRRAEAAFPTASSQVSVLFPSSEGRRCCHLLTGTVDTSVSVFKPFLFVDNIHFPTLIHRASDVEGRMTAEPFSSDSICSLQHPLSACHEEFVRRCSVTDGFQTASSHLEELERAWLREAEGLRAVDAEESEEKSGSENIRYRIQTLFKRCVETEFNFYQNSLKELAAENIK